MKAQDFAEPHTEFEVEPSDDGLSESSKDIVAGPDEASASQAQFIDGELGPEADHVGGDRQAAQPPRVDAKKLQQAIENLVGRIAEARSRGAAAARMDMDARYRPQDPPGHDPEGQAAEPEFGGNNVESQQPPRSERNADALELRMRQIAEIAGAPLAEDLNADIAAIRGKMDRLSRDGGALSTRMETIQRQLSNLRESVDTSSSPVVERLVDLETRLGEIGETLASRHLSVEARTAVEHSCSHILGAIARIEGLTRQAAVPEGLWDQIATVRAKIDRLPTFDKITGLERRIHEVSEQLGAVAESGDRSHDFANLEKRLSDIGASTKAALDDIRERPAYDPTDVRALRERIEAWRREKSTSELPAVGPKLDSIARKVDQLTRSEHSTALAKIQQGLRELTGTVSAQNASISGLDLPGLQRRLARICDELVAVQDDAEPVVDYPPVEPEAPAEPQPLGSGFRAQQEEDEDQELAKRLAIRFAPEGRTSHGSGPGESEAAETNSEDVAGAFDAVQTALEALVGQIPFIDRTWDGAGRSAAPNKAAPSPSVEAKPPTSVETKPPPSVETEPPSVEPKPPSVEPNKLADWLAAASEPPDRPAANELLRSPARKPTSTAAPVAARTAPTNVSSAIAKSDVDPAPAGSDQPENDVAPFRPSTNYASSEEGRAPSADAAHRIGRYSTWRKAKVAVVAANPPKY